MHHWRVYLAYPRIEFGIDYPTLAAARSARDSYQRNFPTARYYIRRHRGPAIAFAGKLSTQPSGPQSSSDTSD